MRVLVCLLLVCWGVHVHAGETNCCRDPLRWVGNQKFDLRPLFAAWKSNQVSTAEWVHLHGPVAQVAPEGWTVRSQQGPVLIKNPPTKDKADCEALLASGHEMLNKLQRTQAALPVAQDEEHWARMRANLLGDMVQEEPWNSAMRERAEFHERRAQELADRRVNEAAGAQAYGKELETIRQGLSRYAPHPEQLFV